MRAIGAALVLAAGALFAQDGDLTVYQTEDQATRECFPSADAFGSEAIRLDDEARVRIQESAGRPVFEHEILVRSAWKGDALLGYAVVSEDMGCYKPITYLVATDTDGRVLDVRILVYRESRGGEVARRRFRNQFVGKSGDDPIRQDRDITNVSGATTSVRAITDGVRKLLAVLREAYLARGTRPGKPRAAAGAQQAPSNGPVRRACVLMGSMLEITAFGDDAGKIAEAEGAAMDEVARLEGVLSHFRDDSELSRAVAAAPRGPVSIGPDLFACIASCERFWKASGGAFDPTVAPLVEAWGFKGGNGRMPSDAEIASALELVGFGHIHLDPEKHTLAIDRDGVRLDLGAIGKGYAVDRAVEVLRSRGVGPALVNFSGNMRAIGAPPGTDGWPVLLRHPRDLEGSLGVVFLRDQAISTSGDYEKSFEVGGKRYHHILDPRTGRPSETACAATVLAESASDADALSTTLCVLEPERGREIASSMEGVQALIVSEASPGGELRFVGTARLLSDLHVGETCGPAGCKGAETKK